MVLSKFFSFAALGMCLAYGLNETVWFGLSKMDIVVSFAKEAEHSFVGHTMCNTWDQLPSVN